MNQRFILPITRNILTRMRKKLTRITLSVGLLAALIYGCKHNPQEEVVPIVAPTPNNPVTNDSVSFQTEILPLIVGNCTMSGCHDAGTAAEGLVLTNYTNIMQIVRPNNPGGSDLIDVITETRPTKRMPPPPSTPLTQAQIDLITKWINEGARNTNIIRCDTTNFTYSGAVSSILSTNCNGCHSNTSTGGGILLNTYSNVKTYAQNGKLLCSIERNGTCSPMPKGGAKLEDCKIKVIKKWVDAGSPNN